MATEEEMRVQRDRLTPMSSDAIRGIVGELKPHAAARIVGEAILEEREIEEDRKSRSPVWHTTWWGVSIITVVCGLIVVFLALKFGWV